MTEITVGSMRDRLLSMDSLRTILGGLEPIHHIPFTVGDPIRFRAKLGWNHGLKTLDAGQPVGVYVSLGLEPIDYQLTKGCVLEVCHHFGLPKSYVEICPADLLVPALNYWFREGLHGMGKAKTKLQFVVDGNGLAVSLTKQGLQPFSNLALLDQALDGIRARHGNVEVLADYKLTATRNYAAVRLIVPNGYRVIESDTLADVWSTGIQFKNSLTGAGQTSIEGYLFRWTCTNGQIDARANSGSFTRRKDATEEEVYAWARQSVDEVLGGLETSLDAVQALTGMHITGSLADTLRDIFERYAIPVQQRTKIIALLEEYPGEITMYVIMNAITQTANEQGLEPSTVDKLLRVGGDIPHSADHRCDSCHRLLHHH